MLDSLLLDLRYALRTLRNRPLLAATGVLTLAIGIAANTLVFGLLNTALFKRVPGVTRPERLVELSRETPGGSSDVSLRMFRRLQQEHALLEDLVALSPAVVSVANGAAVPTVRGAVAVSGDYFGLLGVRAALGRTFLLDEATFPSIAPVAVISDDVWRREFAGAPDVIGRSATINGSPLTIVGVLPPRFGGHHTGLLLDVYVPLGVEIPGLADPSSLSRGAGSLELLGRARAGISHDRALAQLDAVANSFAREVGEATAQQSYRLRLDNWGPLPGFVRSTVTSFLLVLLALVALALAMSCINVTTVLLARASERQREFAIRRAVGARDDRLVRLVLTEVVLLFLAAGIAGIAASAFLNGLIGGVEPPVPVPGRLAADLGIDLRVLTFASLLTLGSACGFSLLPALHSCRFDLSRALREGGGTDAPGRLRLRSGLVGVQVAVTCVLLAATLVFGRALRTWQTLRPGWNGDNVMVTNLDLELNGTPVGVGREFQSELLQRLSARPDVVAASLATKLPMGGRSSFGSVWVPELSLPGDQPGYDAAINRVSPGYLRTMQIPLLVGRDFGAADGEHAPHVAIVNATMARLLWSDGSPVGRTFHVNHGEYQLDFQVVGVAADAELRAPGRGPEPFYYVPLAQWYNSATVLHVRGQPGRSAPVAGAIRGILRELLPTLPLMSIRPLDEALGVFRLPQKLATWVAGLMTGFGMLLAAIGVYGVSAFLASRRAKEIAVRLALGATPRGVMALLLWKNGRGPLIGLGAGFVLAIGVTLAASRKLTGAEAADPVVLIGVPLALGLISASAIVEPIRRQLRRPIMQLLRDS